MFKPLRIAAVVLLAITAIITPAHTVLADSPSPVTLSAEQADVLAQRLAASPVKWIEVILSRQRLNAWENGRIVMSSAISSGLPGTPTRRGTFRVYVKLRSTRMRGPGYDLRGVPYTMYYSGSFAIHGAYWHNNFGRPMSHGCVNLPVGFSGRLFAWTPVGTRVVVR